MKMPKIKVQILPTWNWLPDPRRMVIRRNGNYFRSLVAGCLSPLFHLPQMVWHLLLQPVFNGVLAIVTITVVNFVVGIAGYCPGIDVRITDEDNQEIKSFKA